MTEITAAEIPGVYKAVFRSREPRMNQDAKYLLGHGDVEMERLQLQAACLEGQTRRLIQECGIEAGMAVADFGSGAGDVAMLVAEAVGPAGKVVGIDAEQRAVEMAAARARKAGLRQSNLPSARISTLSGSDLSTP